MSCSPAWNVAGPIAPRRRRRVVTRTELSESEQSTEVIVVSPEESSWVPRSVAKLAEFESLLENWDGYRSPPVGQIALSDSRRFLTTLHIQGLPAPVMLPVGGGGVGLNWVLRSKQVELTFLPDGGVEYLQIINQDLAGEDATVEGAWDRDSFPEKATEMLQWLVRE